MSKVTAKQMNQLNKLIEEREAEITRLKEDLRIVGNHRDQFRKKRDELVDQRNQITSLVDEIVKSVRFDLDWCTECDFFFADDMFGCDKCAPAYGEERMEDSGYQCNLKPCWNDCKNRPKLLMEQCADYHPDFKPCTIYKLKSLLSSKESPPKVLPDCPMCAVPVKWKYHQDEHKICVCPKCGSVYQTNHDVLSEKIADSVDEHLRNCWLGDPFHDRAEKLVKTLYRMYRDALRVGHKESPSKSLEGFYHSLEDDCQCKKLLTNYMKMKIIDKFLDKIEGTPVSLAQFAPATREDGKGEPEKPKGYCFICGKTFANAGDIFGHCCKKEPEKPEYGSICPKCKDVKLISDQEIEAGKCLKCLGTIKEWVKPSPPSMQDEFDCEYDPLDCPTMDCYESCPIKPDEVKEVQTKQ